MNCLRCNARLPNEGPCAKCGWDVDELISAESAYRVGDVVNQRYTIKSVVGTGRLGACYRAVDAKFRMDAVLKFIHPGLLPGERLSDKFLDGMRFLLQNNYTITTKVLEVNRDGEYCYVASEALEGVPLRDLMVNRQLLDKPFTIDEIYPILRQVSAFLIESDAGLHGSLCPDNIWILPGNLKILDVGLVENLPLKAVGRRLVSNPQTRGYVAPELASGEAFDTRSDVYSLGVLLGEMTTKAMYDGRPELFMQANPELPREVDGILRRALLEDPDGRYATAENFMQALARLAGLPTPVFNKPWSKVLEESGLNKVAPPPKRGGYYPERGEVEVIEATAQVAMADVIQQHFEEVTAVAKLPTREHPNVHRSTVPPPQRSRAAFELPAVNAGPPVRVRKEPSNAEGRVSGALLVPPRPSSPPPRPSSPPPRPSSPPSRPFTPPARQVEAGPVSPAPVARPASVPRAAPPRPSVSPPSIRTDVTQEIDIEALESAEARRREVTQEIDIEALESAHHASSSAAEAASRLESQASEAEERSTAELIKHATGLDGVDPRLVRAAHKLQVEKFGAQSKHAAQIVKEKAQELNGIDPRLIRAAARLEEARISEVPSSPAVASVKDPSPDEGEDDWRSRIASETSTNEDSVISFIPSPVMENSSEVQGFPRSQQRERRNRPPSTPPKRR